jgi:hypothetical protein
MSTAQIYGMFAQKLADITNVPLSCIESLRDCGVLNEKEARDKLIRSDYWALVKTKKFTHNQILEKLSGIYDVDKQKVQKVVKVKPKKIYHCKICGSQMRKSDYIRNDGICDRCISKSIKI